MNDVFVVGDVLLYKQDQQCGWLVCNISEEDLSVVAESSIDLKGIEQKRCLIVIKGDAKPLEESSSITTISICKLIKILNKAKDMFLSCQLERVFIVYDINEAKDKFYTFSLSEVKDSPKEKTIFLNLKELSKEDCQLFMKTFTFSEMTKQLKEFIRKEFAKKATKTEEASLNCFKCCNRTN